MKYLKSIFIRRFVLSVIMATVAYTIFTWKEFSLGASVTYSVGFGLLPFLFSIKNKFIQSAMASINGAIFFLDTMVRI